MGSGRSNCIKSRLYLTKSIRLYYYSRYVVCILPTICSTNAYISTLDVVFPQISTFLEDSVVIVNGLIYGPLKSIFLLQSHSFDRKKNSNEILQYFIYKLCNWHVDICRKSISKVHIYTQDYNFRLANIP